MFSVNNFYDIFNSHYGWPKKNNSLRVFNPHGSKDWCDLVPWGDGACAVTQGAIFMHDQEPFFIESASNFKEILLSDYTRINKEWHSRYRFVNIDQLKNLHPIDTLSFFFRSAEVPIFCHSEKNSADITTLEEHNFITCYYWWHGMIARDWFRHWEHHADLNIYNKSNANKRFLFYNRASDGTRVYRQKVSNNIKDCSVKTSSSVASSNMSASIDINDANTTAIHIVAETLFETEKIYLTEKVFKPMVMSQPFILFAAPGSLQYLRDYGFKTFNNYWSEDYDRCYDHNQRLSMVVELIQTINSLAAEEFSSMYNSLLETINFNRNWFYSSNFQSILWKELKDNMKSALDQQSELREKMPGGANFYFYNQLIEAQSIFPEFSVDGLNKTIFTNNLSKSLVSQSYPALAKFIY